MAAAAAASQNPIATGHIPFFVTPPGGTDILFNVVAWFVLLCIIGLGVIFFTIHTLPERMAHRTKKVQLDFVAILGLIALFTNEHIYWIAALILAFIDLPDFLTPVQRIASAVENIAGEQPAAEIKEGTSHAQAEAEKVGGFGSDRSAAVDGASRPGPVEAGRPVQKGSAHA
jgi:hypothetical protein